MTTISSFVMSGSTPAVWPSVCHLAGLGHACLGHTRDKRGPRRSAAIWPAVALIAAGAVAGLGCSSGNKLLDQFGMGNGDGDANAPGRNGDMTYRVEMRRDGRKEFVAETFGFRAGDEYRLEVRPQEAGHLYVYEVVDQGTVSQRLFPPNARSGRSASAVKRNSRYNAPTDNPWRSFAGPDSTRQLYMIWSPNPLMEFEPGGSADVGGPAGLAAALSAVEARRQGLAGVGAMPGGANLAGRGGAFPLATQPGTVPAQNPQNRALVYVPDAPPPGPGFGPAPGALPPPGGQPIWPAIAPRSAPGGEPIIVRVARLVSLSAVTPLPQPGTPGQPGIPGQPGTPGQPGGPDSGRVVALIVADTQSNIGTSCRVDVNTMRDLLGRAVPSQRLQIVELTGRNAAPQAVLNACRSTPVGPQDTVLFYYSGHGAFSPRDGHFLAMSSGNLRRSDVVAALNTQPNRLTVLLTDCCANIVEGSFFPNAITGFAPGAADAAVLADLLTRPAGFVNINACQEGETAGCNNRDGGFFTSGLAQLVRGGRPALDANRNGVVEWSEFFPPLVARTREISRAAAQTSNAVREHTPVAFDLNVR